MSDFQEIIDEKAELWKQLRMGKFTSSSIAALNVEGKKNYFGEAALTYIYKKVAETITQEYNEVSSAAIKWGNEHEADGVAMYAKIKEVEVEHYGKVNPVFIEHGDHAGGSPDGLVITSDSTLEIKCPYESGNHLEAFHLMKMGKFDLKAWDKNYFGQCQFNMFLQEKKTAKFVSYDPRVVDYRFAICDATINYDEAYIKNLLERIEKAIEVKKQYLTEVGFYEEDSRFSVAA